MTTKKSTKTTKKKTEEETVSTQSAITQPVVDDNITDPFEDLLKTNDESVDTQVLTMEEEVSKDVTPIVLATPAVHVTEQEELTFDDLPRVVELSIDELAKIIHESTRISVETGSTVDAVHFGVQVRRFVPWEILKEGAKEGYRSQAKYLFATLGN